MENTNFSFEYSTVQADICSEIVSVRKLTKQEATYLAWIDCRSLGISSAVITQQLSEKAHLLVNEGTLYGVAGEGLVRLKSGLNAISSSGKSLLSI